MSPGEALRQQVRNYDWYHTLDLGDGVVTAGMFDHRPHVDRYLIPRDLSGLRCADVGTMDGFWAFEMERRGATEVVAFDIDDPETLDWPASKRDTVKTLDETKGERFELVRDALGSQVRRELRSVYDLDTDLAGSFDLVFCGDLLVHLKDPVTAVERLRRICRGSAIVCNPIRRWRFLEKRPMATFDGVDEFEWWVTNLTGLSRIVRSAGFERVEAGRPFLVPAAGGGAWKGLRGVVRGYVDPAP